MSAALSRDPKNLSIRFNRAVLNEKMNFLSQAVADWNEYLKLERDSGWRAEAEKRLHEIRRKQELTRLSVPDDRAPPALRSPQATRLASQDPEALLQQSERKILPAIHQANSKDAAFVDAILMGRILRSEHGDPFLLDIAARAGNSGFNNAAAALAEASEHNAEGKPEEAYKAAETAQKLFKRAGSEAGVAAADFEIAYSLQFESKPHECIQHAHRAVLVSEKHQYHWLTVQSSIEEATCLNMLGQIERAGAISDKAIQIASEHGFNSFYLRALLVRAAIKQDSGDVPAALIDVQSGLNDYFHGSVSSVRAFSFYDLITEIARKLNLPHVMLLAALEQASFLVDNPNKEVVASARLHIANIALEAEEPATAEEQSREALQLISSLPRTESVQWRILEANVELAQAQASTPGYRTLALRTLAKSAETLKQIHNRFLEQNYFTTLGEIQQKAGDPSKAEQSLRSAIEIAESEELAPRDIKAALAWRDHNQKPYRLLTQLLFESGHTRQALSAWEHFKARPFSIETRGEHIPDPSVESSTVEQTRSGTATITYAVVPGAILIWSSSPKGDISRRVSLQTRAFRRLAAKFLDECSRPDSSVLELRTDGNALYNWLIWPIRQNLTDTSEIYIRPDEELETLPWEALVDNSGHYLATNYAITLEPIYNGISRQVLLRPSERALVVAPPGLPGAGPEISAVRNAFRNSKVLRDSSATTHATETEIPKHSIFHFVGHAIQQADGSAMVLADGLFDPSNSTRYRPTNSGHETPWRNVKLSVLSACATAKRGYDSSSATPVLVTEFIDLGAQQVLASRWNVDSASTAEFMGVLYGEIGRKPLTEALASARSEVSKDPAKSHPYYWAAFGQFEGTRLTRE
jgi:CHAT domain-containing protein